MKPYYSHKGITIYHGDCREVLSNVTADLCLTDPPYGIAMSSGFSGRDGFGGTGVPIARRQYPDTWDKQRPEADTFANLLKACKSAIIWGGNFFADLLPRATHWIVWDKLQTMPTFSDCELAWTNFDRKSVKKITVEWNGLLDKEDYRDHPTQKPLELMSQCLATYGRFSDSVVDPFMGSGTTLVAAKKHGKSAIGIEIEEKYCEIAAKRLSQEVFEFGE